MEVVSATSPFAFADRDSSLLRGKGLLHSAFARKARGVEPRFGHFPDLQSIVERAKFKIRATS
jgi:hypothetical protein